MYYLFVASHLPFLDLLTAEDANKYSLALHIRFHAIVATLFLSGYFLFRCYFLACCLRLCCA